jgi:protein-tyrosine phosphatase
LECFFLCFARRCERRGTILPVPPLWATCGTIFFVPDFSPPILAQLEQFVKLVDRLPPGTKTIVHCEGGTGRTGTFAAAYWVTKGMTAAEAIMHVRKVRWSAVETVEQEAVLVDFASRMRRRS